MSITITQELVHQIETLINAFECNINESIDNNRPINEGLAIDSLEYFEKNYDKLVEISSNCHKRQHFSIAIFGSARLHSTCSEFRFVLELTKSIVETIPVDIVTGGGPGLMEAANQGIIEALKHQDHKGKIPQSWGLRVQLPFERKGNPYLHVEKFHKHFTTRLQSFVSLIQGAYVGAGGIGTLLELSLLWQLKQVNHLPVDFPLVVAPVWKPILEAFYDMTFFQRKNNIPLINPDNMELIKFSDDIEEIVEIFRIAYQKWQGTDGG
ncbi:MAG: hypothetical protein DRR08_22710 [Candidatus Parabeggiatoa sp. nov. 2]|nr:MAG: hypothetical protein B6247_23790 [Beggiatoa sp. 4572_84]RKZ56019.1 MAG: hypothetical protein DRR08_22710 [Gammaproteobacteria bacterium]